MGQQGNNEGVTRAFDLNAFDHFTRPFAPRVIVARILRIPRLLSTATEARVPTYR
jgi:DNA-binding response OmpR family regulator